MVDPWGGFNEGINNLNNTFVNVRAQDRQSALDAQNADAARQQLAMGAVQLQGAQRSQQNLQDAQAAAAALQPTSRSMLVDQMGPGAPVNNPAAPADRAALAAKIQGMTAQTYNPALPYGDNDVPPETTNLTPEATAAQQQQLAPLQAQMAQPDQIEGAALPKVEQKLTVPITGADRIKAMIQSYESNGDIAAATALKTQVAQHAKTVVDLSGNPADGIKVLNDSLGTNYSVAKMPSFQMIKNGDEVVGVLDEGTMKLDVMNGMSASDAFKKNMAPVQLGGSSKLVADYLAKNPNATAQDVWKLASDNSIPIKAIEPIITELQKAQHDKDMNDRQIKAQAHSDEMQARGQAHSDQIQANSLAAMGARARMYSVLDTQNGNRPIMATSEEIASNPSRYLSGATGAKALGQTNLQEDIKGTVANVRKSLGSLDKDFTPAQAAQLSVAMRSSNPQSAVSNFYQSAVGSTLTLKQQEYIADLQQLTENAMAMRSVLGAGAGSDQVRQAIEATLPNATTPDRKTASMKLDKFEQTVNRLGRGIPKVDLNPMPGSVDTSRPVSKGGVTGYRQPDGSVLDSRGKRLN